MTRAQLNVKLPPDLIAATRAKAAAEGSTVTAVVEAALRAKVWDSEPIETRVDDLEQRVKSLEDMARGY